MFKPLVLTLVLLAGLAPAAEIHVALDGHDHNPGTTRRPLRTLEAARDAARRRPAGEGATIWIHAGRYHRQATFELSVEDSGSSQAPVVYRPWRGAEVVFDGGQIVPPAAFVLERDPRVLARVPEESRDRLLVLDCHSLGLTDFGSFGPRGFGRPHLPAPTELFIDGEPMTYARWPNLGEDWIPLGKVVDPGHVRSHQFSIQSGLTSDPADPYRGGLFAYGTPRAERWLAAKNAYLFGIFAWGFAEDMVKIAWIDPSTGLLRTVEPHQYGFGTGKQPSLWKWYAVNLLEEIDRPGEYFIDTATGRLYLLPPRPLRGRSIQLSVLDRPFVEARGVAHLRLEGLTFENSRSGGVRLVDTHRTELVGCTLRNLGGQAVTVSGTHNLVQSCDIYQTGAGGVAVSGGDRRTLEPGANVVRNCDIHHLNRWYRTYNPAVSVSGVGQRIEHNHLHHCPGQAVVLAGNDHSIEFNEMDHVVSEMSDQGAVYMGRDPSAAGNRYRFNFVHHTDTTHANSYGNSGFFFDDGASGQHVFGNVFFQTGKNGAVKYHGGQFNEFVNNVVIDCAQTVKYQLWTEARWSAFINHESILKRLTRDVNIHEPPYATRYPKLARLYSASYAKATHVEERNFVTTASDPVFVDGAQLNFRIQQLARVQETVPGFEPIPFEEIGLYRDTFRRR